MGQEALKGRWYSGVRNFTSARAHIHQVRVPLTCEVEAVGMGATSSELRTPCAAISRLSSAQSQRPEEGVTPHISYWRIPWLTGEPCNRRRQLDCEAGKRTDARTCVIVQTGHGPRGLSL